MLDQKLPSAPRGGLHPAGVGDRAGGHPVPEDRPSEAALILGVGGRGVYIYFFRCQFESTEMP